MLSFSALLLTNLYFFMLRVSPAAGTFPQPLSAKEERQALQDMRAGDPSAREKLIAHNLRLVAHVVKKYYASREDQDDLVSIGTIGLIKAVSTFNAEKNTRLATYACKCIENEILMYFRSRRKNAGDISLSEALDVESDGEGLSILDVLAVEDDLAERVGTEELCRRLRESVRSALEPREAQIITLRYGLDGKAPRTQKETAELTGISRSYVSRLEKRALEKLREVLGEQE